MKVEQRRAWEEGVFSRIVRISKNPVRTLLNQAKKRRCWACGDFTKVHFEPAYPVELIEGHGFTPEWAEFFNLREYEQCWTCRRNARSRQLAQAIVEQFDPAARSLIDACRRAPLRSMSIAEINECAQLHEFLKVLPNLRHSEYGSTDPETPNEDIYNLSYKDESLDLVLTSDTLEHVPDVSGALAEIRRTLKPGGLHIFSIPVVWDQPETRQRACIRDGELIHLQPPLYHGGSLNVMDCLAFYEYGADVVETVRGAGFEVELIKHPTNRALRTFVTHRAG